MFAAAALSLGSCATNSDIDELKDQLGDLENQIGQLEQAQQQALLGVIADLESQIAALQSELDGTQADLAAEYEALLASLSNLENEVASGAKVHYGNIMTSADFDAFVASESTIVTGDIVVRSNEDVTRLEKLALVGGNLMVKGGTDISLPNLENVSKAFTVEGLTEEATVSLPMLNVVGAELEIVASEGISAVDMPELVMVNGNLEIVDAFGLTSLNAAKLDLVAGDLNIDLGGMYGEEISMLDNLDLSSTDVMGDVQLIGIGAVESLVLGKVDGGFKIQSTNVVSVGVASEVLGGNLEFVRNGAITELLFDNLTTIGGDVVFMQNVASGSGTGGSVDAGFSSLVGFESVTSIDGDVMFNLNKFLTVDAFNNVRFVNGNSITVAQTSGISESWYLFDSLEGKENDRHWDALEVSMNVRTDWFSGFNSLKYASSLVLNPQKWSDFNSLTGEFKQGEQVKFTAFNSISKAGYAEIYLTQVTEFQGLENFYDMTGEFANIHIIMPEDTTVGMCSLMPVLENDAADMNSDINFYDAGWNTMTAGDVVTTFNLMSCGDAGI